MSYKLFTKRRLYPSEFIPPLVNHCDSFEFHDNFHEADFVLLPFLETVNEYKPSDYPRFGLKETDYSILKKETEDLIYNARKFNKKIIAVNFSDRYFRFDIPNSIILQTSLFSSTRLKNEFAFPANQKDYQKLYMNNSNKILKKSSKPRVGFRGSSKPFTPNFEDIVRSSIKLINNTTDKLGSKRPLPYEWNDGQIIRHKAMKVLMKNKHISTDFTSLTRGYIGQNKNKQMRNRKLFIDNLINNEFILCVRGAGNYSFRLYETLSAGRIPLFINTDCVLPLDFKIDWKKYTVWVENSDLDRIDEILLQFFDDLSNDDFEELQVNIRNFWEEWIKSESFWSNFDMILEDRKLILEKTF